MDYDKAASVWVEKDKDSAHMEEAALKNKIDEFIQAHNTCALAVASGDFVRCTPIEYINLVQLVWNCKYHMKVTSVMPSGNDICFCSASSF